MKKIYFMIFAFISGIFGFNGKAQSPDQRNLALYQIMVASFQHGDGGAVGYKAMWGPEGHRKDGNLRGIINALPHIKSLNVNGNVSSFKEIVKEELQIEPDYLKLIRLGSNVTSLIDLS